MLQVMAGKCQLMYCGYSDIVRAFCDAHDARSAYVFPSSHGLQAPPTKVQLLFYVFFVWI